MGTCIGAMLTISLAILSIVFAGQKFILVAEQSNAFITTAELQNFYSSEDAFGAEQGLNIAVALWGYGAAFTNGSLDPTYAKIKAVSYGWTPEAEYFNELKTHPCSQEELGLTGNSNSQFMPTNVEEVGVVTYSKENFICVDKQELKIYGDTSSSVAQIFQYELHRCSDRADCKSDDEITQGLKGAVLVGLHNQIHFDSRFQADESIK